MLHRIDLEVGHDDTLASIGKAVLSDRVRFVISGLTIGNTYQYLIKSDINDADIDALTGDYGTISAKTMTFDVVLSSDKFNINDTYYFGLRQFDGSSSQEVIRVKFTIAKNVVLGSGTSVLILPPDAVTSVNTKNGVVTLTQDDILDGDDYVQFSNANKSKLDSITEIFTTALKSAYDSASAWIITNGVAILFHISATTNPHNVTQSQVGLGNVDNTSDLNKPISTATQTALNLKANTADVVTLLGDQTITGLKTFNTAGGGVDLVVGDNTTGTLRVGDWNLSKSAGSFVNYDGSGVTNVTHTIINRGNVTALAIPLDVRASSTSNPAGRFARLAGHTGNILNVVDEGDNILGGFTKDGNIQIVNNSTPSSASATGTKGEIRWDANYIYVCTATNTWKATPINQSIEGYLPTNYGFKSWSYDPVSGVNTSPLTSGTIQICKNILPFATTISNVHIIRSNTISNVTTAYMAIYQGNTRLGQTADIGSTFLTSGILSVPLTAPVSVSAGEITIAVLYVGSDTPTVVRASGFLGSVTGIMTGGSLRFATADSGVTTMPSTLGTRTTSTISMWVATS